MASKSSTGSRAGQNQKTIPTLHNLAHSQAFRCLWALEEIALINPSFKYNVVNYKRQAPHNPELAKHHRLGKSPIVTLESVDPAVPVPTPQLEPGVLTESTLILQYINDEYADHLWDVEDEEDRKRDVFFTQFAVDTVSLKAQFTMLFDILPIMLPFPLNYIVGLMVAPMVKHFKADLDPIYQILDDELSEELPWFSGKEMGLADFNMQFALDLAQYRGYIDKEKYPKVAGWIQKIRAREGYKGAIEKSGGPLDLKYFGLKLKK
jgi:glutathione S-transferase